MARGPACGQGSLILARGEIRSFTYQALAYYHDHPREMSEVEAEREDAMETFRESIDRPAEVFE